MKIILLIRRFDPEKGGDPFFQPYEVEVESNTRLLDALLQIRRTKDPTLAFRASCGHGVCGSDAIVINGKERLACRTLALDVADKEGDVVIIEPIRTFPVLKDLVVDLKDFFDGYRSVKPYLIPSGESPGRERRQTPEERKVFDDATNCILCASCLSACPVVRSGAEFLGPASIAQAFRFNTDSRDAGFEERLPALDRPGGVWPCESKAECTRVCPREIRVALHINETKRQIKHFRGLRGESTG